MTEKHDFCAKGRAKSETISLQVTNSTSSMCLKYTKLNI